jgi:hypothetical protein
LLIKIIDEVSPVPGGGARAELLELDVEEDVDETDDLLLDDELLALLTALLVLDIEEDFDETTDDADETLLVLLTLDIDDKDDDETTEDEDDILLAPDIDDAEETLAARLEDTLDDVEEIDELLTLPVSAALDEPFTTVPPVQPLIDRQATTNTAAKLVFVKCEIIFVDHSNCNSHDVIHATLPRCPAVGVFSAAEFLVGA